MSTDVTSKMNTSYTVNKGHSQEENNYGNPNFFLLQENKFRSRQCIQGMFAQ